MSALVRFPERAIGRTPRIAIAGLDAHAADEVVRCLRARGLGNAAPCELDALAAAVEDGALAAAWIEPDAATAAALAPVARAAAAAARPLVIFARPGRGRAVEPVAALAFLRAHGAAICTDADAWLEGLCLIARHGVPEGARAAVIAPPGSWLAVAAAGLGIADAGEDAPRRPALADSAGDLAPADVALVDAASWHESIGGASRGAADGADLAGADRPAANRAASGALLVPVIARAELAHDAPAGALWGLRPALAAIAAVGQAAARARAGLGAATRSARGELDIDEERLSRQLAKLNPGDLRLGDHETKVLLAAYGVTITRQAVATTPSGALTVAKRAGFPVDIKPWGADVPSERAGCPIERNVATAAEVRRAYAMVLGGPSREEGAVIVREAVPPGREVAATISPLGALGWTVVLDVPGHAPVAAPAPLRLADATHLAAALVATRAGDDEPDRAALANLLRRASHLVVDHADRITRLELSTILVGAKGERTLVVDASTALRK